MQSFMLNQRPTRRCSSEYFKRVNFQGKWQHKAETCITLPGRVRRIERHRLSGYQSLGIHKHLDEPQNCYKNIILEIMVVFQADMFNSHMVSHICILHHFASRVHTKVFIQDVLYVVITLTFLFQLPCAGPELLSCSSAISVLTSAVAAVPSSFPKGRHLESTEETSTMRKTVRTNSSRLACCYHSMNKDILSSTTLAFDFQMASLGQVRNLEANSRSMAALSSASQKIASQQPCMPRSCFYHH